MRQATGLLLVMVEAVACTRVLGYESDYSVRAAAGSTAMAGAMSRGGVESGNGGSAPTGGAAEAGQANGGATSDNGGSAPNGGEAEAGQANGGATGDIGGSAPNGGEAEAGQANGGAAGGTARGGAPTAGASGSGQATGGQATGGTAGAGAQATGLVAGQDHSCVRFENGMLKCWGRNTLGQLGMGDAVDRADNANEMGSSLPPVDLGTGRTVTETALGSSHTCAVLDSGQVKCWGSGGQLGLGDTNHRGDSAGEMGDSLPAVDLGTARTATAIASRVTHTCAILDSGQVKCWGSGGQLGLGDTSHRGDSAGEMGDSLPVVDLGTGRTATAIAAGGSHTCALLDNAQVKCWAQNNYGQLGLGDTSHRGDGAGEMGDSLPVVDLGTGRTATAIAAGGSHTCALLDNAQVKCWGYNDYGQLGLGDTSHRGDGAGEMGDSLPAVDLGTGRTATAIAAGGWQTCAILDNVQLKCWGNNSHGQLGLGDTSHRGDSAGEMGDSLPAVDLGTGRTSKTIAVGTNHTCALLDNAQVKCWGQNDRGDLGLGDSVQRGDNAREMGDNLPAVVFW